MFVVLVCCPQVLEHITSPEREWHRSILCCYWLQYQLHRQLKQVNARDPVTTVAEAGFIHSYAVGRPDSANRPAVCWCEPGTQLSAALSPNTLCAGHGFALGAAGV